MALNLLAQAALMAGSALAPWAIEKLLNEGLPAEMTAEGTKRAVGKEQIAKRIKQLERAGAKPERIAKALGKTYGGRKAIRGLKRPGLLTPTPGKLGAGVTAAFLLPMFGIGAGGGEEVGGMEMGGGGQEEDILGLIGALQQQAQGSESETRSEFNRTQAALNMMDRRDMARATPTTLGMGRAAALEELIRGQEDQLAQLSYNEPMTLAQAYAMQGLYRPMDQSRVNFRDLI